MSSSSFETDTMFLLREMSARIGELTEEVRNIARTMRKLPPYIDGLEARQAEIDRKKAYRALRDAGFERFAPEPGAGNAGT